MVYCRYSSSKEASLSALASSAGVYWVGMCGGVKGSKGGKEGHELHPLPVSVSCTWLLYGPCSWLCGSGEMGMSSG